MTNEEWGEWVADYSATQGLGSEADRAMLGAWKVEFIRHERKDLDEAWRRLKGSDAILRWRADHRRFLHVHLNEILRERAKLQRVEVEDDDARYRCSECFGSGHVMVPHPAKIKDGIWDYKTELTIACNCTLGLQRASKFNAQAREHSFQEMRDIPWADHVIPEWREMILEKQRRQKDSQMVDDYTRTADKQGPIRHGKEFFKAVIEKRKL